MSEEITFFDLPSKGGNHCWSPNTWKTRIYLNFKALPYKTVWIEYPDIKPTFTGHVLPDETGKYSLPSILLPDGTYIRDSQAIAAELEKRHPTPSVNLNTAYLPRLQEVLAKVIDNVRPDLIPKVPKRFLNEASVPYFNDTREKAFGMALDRLEIESGGSICYTNARPFVEEVGAMLRENPDGPFFEGKQVTYADFVWVTYLKFAQRLGDDELKNLVGQDKDVHLALLQACQPWLERDNY